MAADGFSVIGIAKRLHTSADTFRRWLEEYPDLNEAFENGRENERWALHNMLYREAMEKKNIVAGLFLLKARHNYREGEVSDGGNKVKIVFQLPAALSMSEYENMKVIGSEQSNNRNEPIPATHVSPARRS